MPPKKSDDNQPAYRFRGFQNPTYTIVPDEVFDELLTVLSGSELKALLYIIRRTFGFKKDADKISLSQMLNGIIRKEDGRRLDHGAGLSKPTLLQALRSLQDKNIIEAERQRSADKGDEPTIYRLCFADGSAGANKRRGGQNPNHPVVKEFDQGGGKESLPGPRARNLTTQDPVEQKTVEQDLSKIRKTSIQENQDRGRGTDRSSTPSPSSTTAETRARIQAKLARTRKGSSNRGFTPIGDEPNDPTSKESDGVRPVGRTYDEARQVLVSYMTDYARELGDTAPLQSTVTRAYNLLQRSGLDLNQFISKLYEARAKTQERTATITGRGGEPDRWGQARKTKMPYFFSVLEDSLGLKDKSSDRRQKDRKTG